MRESVMASSPDVVEYICFQLRHAGDISFRKMFGDYGLYCGRTFFGLVCDNQLYVKITESGLKMFPQQEQGCPYPGARPHFLVTDLDDDRTLSSLVRETCSILAVPSVLEGKKKKASGEKEAGALRRLPAGNGCWRGRLFPGSFRSGQRGEVLLQAGGGGLRGFVVGLREFVHGLRQGFKVGFRYFAPFCLALFQSGDFLLRSASFDKSLFAFRAARGSSNSLTEGTAVLRRMMAVTASRGSDWIRACTISLVFSNHASKASHMVCASSSFVFSSEV